MKSDLPLVLSAKPGLHLRSCGWFVSRGVGTHPTRTIADHELILVTQGSLALIDGGQRFDLIAGEWLLLRPGVEHRGAAPYARDCAFVWLHFDPTGTGGGLRLPRRGRAARPERALELARRILDEHERPEPADLLKDLLLAALCAELATPRPDATADRDAVADRAQRILVLRFAEPLSTADLAGELGCHPDHLTRAYRQRFGHPPLEGLHRRRVAHARGLLTGSATGQEEIAAACGYADVRHFRRWFRRLAGVTPGAWRRLHGRVHLNTA